MSRARRLTLRSSRRVPAGRFRPSFHSRPYAPCLHARLNSNVRRHRTQYRDNAALVQASKEILPRISDSSVPPPSMTSHKLRKHFAIQSMDIEQSQFKRSGEPRTAATCLHSANASTGAKGQRASVKTALCILISNLPQVAHPMSYLACSLDSVARSQDHGIQPHSVPAWHLAA